MGLIALAACAARGPIEDPIARNLTWFSYVAGEDIRAACGEGASDRYRFVYNAVWGEQTRTYDVTALPGGGGLQITRVFGSVSLTSLDLFDPQGPWRGARSEVRLDPAGMARVAALVPGEDAAKPGTRLRSDDFYWTAAACKDGRFLFQAWDSDTPDFPGLPFFKVLQAADLTGVPPRPWRKLALGPFDPTGDGRSPGPTRQTFQLEVGQNGLRTGPPIL